MNIKQAIESIVNELIYIPFGSDEPVPVAFGYGRKYDNNINADNDSFPRVYLIEPDMPGFRVKAIDGNVADRYNLFLQFLILQAPEMGQQAEYRYDSVEEMRTLAAQFLYRLSESDLFEDITETVPAVLLVDYLDANVTGIEINLAQLTSLQPRMICI
jgi:hypothetical protein